MCKCLSSVPYRKFTYIGDVELIVFSFITLIIDINLISVQWYGNIWKEDSNVLKMTLKVSITIDYSSRVT